VLRVGGDRSSSFDVELGPVFCNFLLADEINRAPAKVQSALLEVMQERQVTIGTQTHPVPRPFLVLATQNPIESEGTYPLPEAQVDRFLLKLLVDYPSTGEEAAVVGRSLQGMAEVRERLTVPDLERFSRVVANVHVDRSVVAYAVQLADVTRHPGRHGLPELEPYVQFGASPRGPIGLAHAARALALLRGRRHVIPEDVRDLAPDVLRHRIVLSYDALSEGVTTEDLLPAMLDAVAKPNMGSLRDDPSIAAA
jgi:MoxR-like ATPase